MSCLTGFRNTGNHDTLDTFRRSTPDRCSRSRCTGYSGFLIRYTPDISGAKYVVSCTRKIFRSVGPRRFELATFEDWGLHSPTEGIAALFIYRLFDNPYNTGLYTMLIVFLCCFLLCFCFIKFNFLLISILLFLFVILFCVRYFVLCSFLIIFWLVICYFLYCRCFFFLNFYFFLILSTGTHYGPDTFATPD